MLVSAINDALRLLLCVAILQDTSIPFWPANRRNHHGRPLTPGCLNANCIMLRDLSP